MAIYHKGQKLSKPLHEGKAINQIYHMGKEYFGWLSLSAKTAIKAAFGAEEGKEVISKTNDYLNAIALTDTERAQQLAMFINEDPMMVCSLGLVVPGVAMPIRTLLSDGAYIDTRVIPTNSMSYRFIGKMNNGSFAGARTKVYGGLVVGIRSMDFFPTNPSQSTRWTFGDLQQGALIEFAIDNKICKLYVNNSLYTEKTFTNANGNTTYTCQVFEINDAGMHYQPSSGTNIALALGIIGDSRYYVPFKLGKTWEATNVSIGVSQSAGTCGMLDLVSRKFFPNDAPSGSFTIEYILPDGTPWTPADNSPSN